MQPAEAGGDGKTKTVFVIVGFLVLMVAFIDRQIIALLAEPIRLDMGLSDFQISLLGGLAFALFYAVCAIPIGLQIDSRNRPHIIGIGILGWSVATLTTGFATSFAMIFALRVVVAVGEATASPGIVSMATDYFAGKGLGRAIALITLGGVAGQGVALIGGGLLLGALAPGLHTSFGFIKAWQAVFICAAIPGLAMAPVIGLLVREPPRRLAVHDESGQLMAATFQGFWQFLAANRATVIGHAAGYSIFSIAEKALVFWGPTYLTRMFHYSFGKAGYMFGVIVVVTTVVGNYCSGWLTDHWRRAGKLDAALRVGRLTAAVSILPLLALPFVSTPAAGLLCLACALFCMSGYTTVQVAQALVAPNQARAQYTAFYLFVSNIVGGVIGTSLVAVLNEKVFVGSHDIGWPMAIVCTGACAVATVILILTGRPYRQSVRRMQLATAEPVHGP